jgi:hypothetical protein
MPRQPLTMQVETSLAVLLSGRLGLLETPHPASPPWPADAVPWADLVVPGPVLLTDVASREIAHPDPMSLCRCGQSGNKPFCDGTHITIDFDGTLSN